MGRITELVTDWAQTKEPVDVHSDRNMYIYIHMARERERERMRGGRRDDSELGHWF